MSLVVSARPLWADGTEGGADEFDVRELEVVEDADIGVVVGEFLTRAAQNWLGQITPDDNVVCDAVEVTITRRGVPS